MATLNRQLGSLPLQDGNLIELIPGYTDSIRRMTEAVEGAASTVEVEFYIAAWDDVTSPFFEALVAAAARGVTVRLLFDHLASRGIPGYKEFVARLEGTGIEWHPMLSLHPLKGQFQRPDLRNHRKLMVVDGRIAFMGSQNLIEPGYNKPKNHAVGRKWVELVARIDGPTVNALRAVFAQDWFIETHQHMGAEITPDTVAHHPEGLAGQVLPSGPGYVTENNLRLFTALIYSAQRRISLTSPYFVPDEPLLYAVTTAARRGVEVELFVSEEGDQFMVYHAQCSYYAALLEAGVRIYLYPAPAVLHSKHFSIDDDVAVIGSSNMDMRSFALNYEVSLMLTGGDIVPALPRGRGHLPRAVPRAHARGVVAAVAPGDVRRQRHAAHVGAAVGLSLVRVAHGARAHQRRHDHDIKGDDARTPARVPPDLRRARRRIPQSPSC